jgi:AraC-like DNA-binding protein
MANPAPGAPSGNTRTRSTNRFERATSGEEGWHAHAGGQFTLVETGLSHLLTEAGTWIIPTHRVGWVPPGVRHASRSSGLTKGWVVLAPVEFARNLPKQVCVLRASSLMIASLERLTRLAAQDSDMHRLLWKVVAAEMREARPEKLEVPMPSAPRMRKAVQTVLDAPTIAADLDSLAERAGMSRRSFTRHFHEETGLSFSRWRRAVIAHHALERIAAGHDVSTVAFAAGYESVSAFIAMFRRKYGASPGQFLREHADEYRDIPST